MLFPISLLGYVIWVGTLLIRRTPGVSTTAQGPLSARWTMHNLGVREDEAANRLWPILPGVPWLGVRQAAWPLMYYTMVSVERHVLALRASIDQVGRRAAQVRG